MLAHPTVGLAHKVGREHALTWEVRGTHCTHLALCAHHGAYASREHPRALHGARHGARHGRPLHLAEHTPCRLVQAGSPREPSADGAQAQPTPGGAVLHAAARGARGLLL